MRARSDRSYTYDGGWPTQQTAILLTTLMPWRRLIWHQAGEPQKTARPVVEELPVYQNKPPVQQDHDALIAIGAGAVILALHAPIACPCSSQL